MMFWSKGHSFNIYYNYTYFIVINSILHNIMKYFLSDKATIIKYTNSYIEPFLGKFS